MNKPVYRFLVSRSFQEMGMDDRHLKRDNGLYESGLLVRLSDSQQKAKNMIGQRMMVGQRLALGFCVTLMVASLGCDKEQTDNALTEAGEQIEEAGESISENVDKAVEKGEEAAKEAGEKAKELGEKAMAYLNPLKEKFGDLESLKEKPEELKTAVNELLKSLEEKTENLELPETVSKSLEAAKEKLIALRDYLGGEIEQAKIDEHLKEIGNAVKESLGMS